MSIYFIKGKGIDKVLVKIILHLMEGKIHYWGYYICNHIIRIIVILLPIYI